MLNFFSTLSLKFPESDVSDWHRGEGIIESFENFRESVLKFSKLHKNILATDISYNDMRILMETQFEMDEITLYYITH